MTPNYEDTRRFLQWLYPNGPWILTAISINKKSIESESFDDLDTAITWIQERSKFNLYYSVNQPLETSRHKKKLSKTDVESVHYLHVDVDPRAGEDVEAEQARIKNQIESYRIPPSCVIFSGGGYNALWKLSSPITLLAPSPEEHVRNAIEVERRNWQFELDFATPDHCRDVSRILRLPGTVNWPNAEKVAKGRVPALSRLHTLTDVVYDYGTFMATPSAPVNVSSSSAKITQDVKRIESVDDLEVPERIKKVIVQGYDPDDPKSLKSRSEWLFFICCELVRHNVPDEIIHGIITDSRFAISESVLDKGSGIARYALRQISRARDMAIDPRLVEMNDKFAVIENYGGKCVVMKEEDDGTQTFQNPKEFFAARASSHIVWKNDKGREVVISDGKWWFNQARRRQYERVVFDPSSEATGAFNTFRGFAVQPAIGTKHETFLEHIRENICSGRQDHYDYLIRWMARAVQQPKTQSEVAVVLIGGRGTGKSFFCRHFTDLFGSHGVVIDNMDHLTGRFNAHLADKLVVVAEEAYHVYDRRNESVLKELITGRRRAIERKGYDVFWRSNYVHLLMTSNNDRVVPAGDHERRFFVLRVSESKIQNSAYFSQIESEMTSGGQANLMHFLLSLDLDGYEVRNVPKTEALVQQQIMSMSYELDWLMNKLQTGTWIRGSLWEGPIQKEPLYRDYLTHVVTLNQQYPFSYRVWHDWLVRQIPGLQSKQLSPQGDGSRPVAFMFPPLKFCRDEFLKARSWPKYDWEEPTGGSSGGDAGDGGVFG